MLNKRKVHFTITVWSARFIARRSRACEACASHRTVHSRVDECSSVADALPWSCIINSTIGLMSGKAHSNNCGRLSTLPSSLRYQYAGRLRSYKIGWTTRRFTVQFGLCSHMNIMSRSLSQAALHIPLPTPMMTPQRMRLATPIRLSRSAYVTTRSLTVVGPSTKACL